MSRDPSMSILQIRIIKTILKNTSIFLLNIIIFKLLLNIKYIHVFFSKYLN